MLFALAYQANFNLPNMLCKNQCDMGSIVSGSIVDKNVSLPKLASSSFEISSACTSMLFWSAKALPYFLIYIKLQFEIQNSCIQNDKLFVELCHSCIGRGLKRLDLCTCLQESIFCAHSISCQN